MSCSFYDSWRGAAVVVTAAEMAMVAVQICALKRFGDNGRSNSGSLSYVQISGKNDPSISSSKNKLKTLSWQERQKLERDRKQKEEDEQTLTKVEAPIPQSHIGFKLLKQMGYTSGAALAKRVWVGLSQSGLRFDDRELRWQSKRVVANFHKVNVALDQLENREIIELEKNDDDEEEEDEEEEEITKEDLQEVLMKLRDDHNYCLFCGCKYESKDDLLTNCPGTNEDDH
ncbi:hypothetical protein AAHE18_02G064500 [Arachis hypogaea]